MDAYYLLERALGEWCGVPSIVGCSSGTAALHLALESFRLRPGKVIVPDLTMVACARAVSLARLEPIFVDCDDYLLMDMRMFRAAVKWCGRNLRAVMAVHLYGRQQNMASIYEILRQELGEEWPNQVKVIEDLAEAHGIKPGGFTDASCWSFYRNKVVAGEEGGAIAFRESMFANNARCLRCLGFTPHHDFSHVPGGHNYRLANCLAEKILTSLGQYEGNLADRRRIEALYDQHCPKTWLMPPRQVPWVYDLRIPGLACQDRLVHILRHEGIEARHCFKPMCHQQEYDHCRTFVRGNASKAAKEVVYLPIQPGVTEISYTRYAFEVIRRVLDSAAVA